MSGLALIAEGGGTNFSFGRRGGKRTDHAGGKSFNAFQRGKKKEELGKGQGSYRRGGENGVRLTGRGGGGNLRPNKPGKKKGGREMGGWSALTSSYSKIEREEEAGQRLITSLSYISNRWKGEKGKERGSLSRRRLHV